MGVALHLSFGEKRESPTLLEVDTIVLCTGQEPLRELAIGYKGGACYRKPG